MTIPPRDALDDPLLASLPVTQGQRCLGAIAIERRIGEDEVWIRYRARNPVLGRDVEVRIFREDILDRPQAGYVLRRELTPFGKLHHEALLILHDAGEALGLLFVVVESFPARTVRELVAARGPLREHDALTILLAVAKGLAVLHTAGVRHQGVEADNVLVSGAGHVKLGLPGMAPFLMVGGARSFHADACLAPEVLRDSEARWASEVWCAGDVWSAGALLHYMLEGRPMFTEEERLALEAGRATPRPQIETGVAPATRALFERCTEHRAERRFSDARPLVRALAELVGEATTLPPFEA